MELSRQPDDASRCLSGFPIRHLPSTLKKPKTGTGESPPRNCIQTGCARSPAGQEFTIYARLPKAHDLPSSLMSVLESDEVTAAAKKLDAKFIALAVHATGSEA